MNRDVMPIDQMRQDYSAHALSESDVASDPIDHFHAWMAQAAAAPIVEPNAMTLSTVAPDGRPSARLVLLKGVDARGFTFYTNRESRKGREIAGNPQVALTFFWEPLHRQVRIEGRADALGDDDADAYFASRPRESQLGAWASEQSSEVPDRAALERRFKELDKQYEGQPVPRPPQWGGYLVVPNAIEFWQGRVGRLHDRLRFERAESGWRLVRLAP